MVPRWLMADDRRRLFLVADDLLVRFRVPLRSRRSVRDRVHHVEDQPDNARLLLGVDLLRRIARLMVVLVHAVEEEDGGHAAAREVVVVGPPEEILLWPGIAHRRYA